MKGGQSKGPSPELKINRQLIIFSVSIGIVAFLSAVVFVLRANHPIKEFATIAGVIFFIAAPVFFTPMFLMLRNLLLNLMSAERLLEVVLSTRVMKRFGIIMLSLPILLFIYIALLEESIRGTWLIRAVQITLALLFAWSFTLVQILEVRQYEKQYHNEIAPRLREFSLGRFVLRLLPSLLAYLTASLTFFAGFFCTIFFGRFGYILFSVAAAVVFFLLGRWFSKRLAAQFVYPNPEVLE